MAGTQDAELPWKHGCSQHLADELGSIKNYRCRERSWALLRAGSRPGCSSRQPGWVSDTKRFHLRQHLRENLKLANPQLPDEEFSHQLQVRPNVPAARAVQPLIITSEQINSKTCQAETPQLLSVLVKHLLLIAIHVKRGEKGWRSLRDPAPPSSSALNHSAHFSLERLSGAHTGINFSLS